MIQILCCFWSIGWLLKHWLWCFHWNCMIPITYSISCNLLLCTTDTSHRRCVWYPTCINVQHRHNTNMCSDIQLLSFFQIITDIGHYLSVLHRFVLLLLFYLLLLRVEQLIFHFNRIMLVSIEYVVDFWDLYDERWPWTNHRRCPATWEEHVGSWLLHVWKLLHGIIFINLYPCSLLMTFYVFILKLQCSIIPSQFEIYWFAVCDNHRKWC